MDLRGLCLHDPYCFFVVYGICALVFPLVVSSLLGHSVTTARLRRLSWHDRYKPVCWSLWAICVWLSVVLLFPSCCELSLSLSGHSVTTARLRQSHSMIGISQYGRNMRAFMLCFSFHLVCLLRCVCLLLVSFAFSFLFLSPCLTSFLRQY